MEDGSTAPPNKALACPRAVDDAVERVAGVGTRTPHVVGRVINSQDFFDQLPERVGSITDRRQGLLFDCSFLGRSKSWGLHAIVIGVWLLLLETRLLQ